MLDCKSWYLKLLLFFLVVCLGVFIVVKLVKKPNLKETQVEFMSEEEKKKLDAEIDQYRNSLSPEEQAEFDAQVEELIKPMEESEK